MKRIIMGLALLTSMSTFAGTGVENCKSLLGNYSCDYEGQSLELSLSKGTVANSVKVSLDGDSQEIILDGVLRNSTVGNSQKIAECNQNKEIVIDSYYKDELKGSMAISKTATGATYTIVKASGSIILNCKKN